MKTTIIMQNKSAIKAEGKVLKRNNRPVVCITNPAIFARETDAAERYEVTPSAIYLACIGRTKFCKGNKFCYLDQVHEHLDEIMQNYAKAKAKANELDKIKAAEEAAKKEREAARREEELREKAAMKRAKAIEKAKANVARRQQILENNEKRIQESQRRLTAAIRELSELEAIVNEC